MKDYKKLVRNKDNIQGKAKILVAVSLKRKKEAYTQVVRIKHYRNVLNTKYIMIQSERTPADASSRSHCSRR